MNIDKIVVNGKVYKLQHPGNREWIKLKQALFTVKKDGTIAIDMEAMIDYCFEHVVFPEEGGKLKLDDCDLIELEEVWAIILPGFLRGQLESGYVYPEDRKSKKEGQLLLQEASEK